MPDITLDTHVARVRACRLCPDVIPPPVAVGVALPPPGARIYQLGQAPGPTEQKEGRAFCGPSGRTLFRWYASIGVEEAVFRERVFMGAVLRCFPGKLEGRQGDRRPAPAEIERCRAHFERELALLRPELAILVGKMAIERFLPKGRLDDVVGRTFDLEHGGHSFQALPLPHPSGLNRWIQQDPGKTLLQKALARLAGHPAWRAAFEGGQGAE